MQWRTGLGCIVVAQASAVCSIAAADASASAADAKRGFGAQPEKTTRDARDQGEKRDLGAVFYAPGPRA